MNVFGNAEVSVYQVISGSLPNVLLFFLRNLSIINNMQLIIGSKFIKYGTCMKVGEQ